MTKDLADELERLALQEQFSIVDLDLFVQANLPAILSALRGEAWSYDMSAAPHDSCLVAKADADGATWVIQADSGRGWQAENAYAWKSMPPPPKGTTHE